MGVGGESDSETCALTVTGLSLHAAGTEADSQDAPVWNVVMVQVQEVGQG